MYKSTPEVGTTFYLRKPTKKTIKDHSLTVEKYDLTLASKRRFFSARTLRGPKGLKINNVNFPNSWFDCTVLFTDSNINSVGPSNSAALKGFTNIVVTIIDKERIKVKRNIRDLVGKRIVVPTCLLKKRGQVIDLREMPTSAHECIRGIAKHDPAFLISSRVIIRQDNKTPTELLAFCRKNHIAGFETKPAGGREEIDLGILIKMCSTMVTSPGVASVNHGALVCECGTVADFSLLMEKMIDHTSKKRARYKYTYTCLGCRVKYVITTKDYEVTFSGVGKNSKKRMLTVEEFHELLQERGGRGAARRLRTTRRQLRARRPVEVELYEDEPDDDWDDDYYEDDDY